MPARVLDPQQRLEAVRDLLAVRANRDWIRRFGRDQNGFLTLFKGQVMP